MLLRLMVGAVAVVWVALRALPPLAPAVAVVVAGASSRNIFSVVDLAVLPDDELAAAVASGSHSFLYRLPTVYASSRSS